jgi:Putative Flp pilus-assembly TadE/G-like
VSALRRESGQATVLTVVFLIALIGMMGAVLDVGAWFRADRKLQANSDAAALAGAQDLPEDVGAAIARAVEYGDKNGGDVEATDVSFETKVLPNDTIVVETERAAPGVFTGIFGIDSVQVNAVAKARTGTIAAARYAAPIAVDIKHPLLQCKPLPCFEQGTTLDLQKVGPGAFRLINLDGSHGGTGPGTLAEWILRGYDGYMPINWYFSDPGAKFNSSHVKDALNQRIGDELLFPIYDDTKGGGANFEYHVIGWVGFVVTSFEANGSKGKIDGYFKRVIWEGIMSESAPENNFGSYTINLVE